jgi:hypothetical protein
MLLNEKQSVLAMNNHQRSIIYRIGAKLTRLCIIALVVFIFHGCEKDDLVTPNSATMRKKTDYLESSYGNRQDGSPVLVKIGITEGSSTNGSFENKEDDTITDKDGDDGDGDGDGDSGIVDQDGDDDDGDGEGITD